MKAPLSHSPKAPGRRPAPVPNPTVQGTASFSKADRLRQRKDFLRVQAQGRRLHTRHFGVILAPGAEGGPRLGLVATRRLGKAVRRNRIKRLLREFFRRHKAHLPPLDLVVMAKKGADTLNYLEVQEELSRVLFSRKKVTSHD